MSGKKVAVVMHKGGVGKTTVAVNLGSALRAQGSSVALYDADPQGSLCTLVESAQPVTAHQIAQHTSQSGTAYTIVDAPPALNGTMHAAIQNADLVVIPTRPGQVDLDALGDTLDACEEHMTPHAHAVIVITQAFVGTPDAQDAAEAIAVAVAGRPRIHLANALIHSRIAYARALNEGLGVLDYRPTDKKACAEITHLTQELFEDPAWQRSAAR